MPEDVEVQKGANADQVTPTQDIDLEAAALDAERRLAGEVPEIPAIEPVVEPEVKEEVKEPVVEATPEPPKEDTEDHKERTKLGRKVAKLEDTIGRLLEQNQTLLQKIVIPPAQPQSTPEPEYIDLSSPEGLDRFLTQREQQRTLAVQREKIEYSLGYEAKVRELSKSATENEDTDAAEIHKLLIGDTPFNVRRSSNPDMDFDINFSKAEAHYYKKKAQTPPEKKSPLQNEPPRAPLSVGGESKVDPSGSNTKPLKISPAAMEFAKAQGWGDEEVAKILSAPAHNSFVKGRR